MDGIIETVMDKVENQKNGFIDVLLGSLDANILSNMMNKNKGRALYEAGDYLDMSECLYRAVEHPRYR